MNLQFYEEKLGASEIFEEFRRENPGTYLCSVFAIIDNDGKNNKVHFDYVARNGKVFSFQMEDEIKKVPLESSGENAPEKLSIGYGVDFGEIEGMILERMQEEKIGKKLQKIIFSMQKIGGKDFIIGTVFIPIMGMIKIRIEMPSKKIVEFEKKSFMDIMSIVKKGS